MYVLQNTKTKQFFCEFQDHINTDTDDINEAAEFDNRYNAMRLTALMEGSYSVELKNDLFTKNKNNGKRS